MDTAAIEQLPPYTAYNSSDGYAIPIAKALTIAKRDRLRKLVGNGTRRRHRLSAFRSRTSLRLLRVRLPVAVVGGATVVGVVSGGPAEAAGLVPGDLITAVDGRR